MQSLPRDDNGLVTLLYSFCEPENSCDLISKNQRFLPFRATFLPHSSSNTGGDPDILSEEIRNIVPDVWSWIISIHGELVCVSSKISKKHSYWKKFLENY